MIEDFREFRVSNDALAEPAELRQRMADDGYVFFRGLLDPDRLRGLRRDMLEVIAANGWLVPGTDPMDGIADPNERCTEGDLAYVEVYHQLYRLESFHRAGHWPEVIDVLAKVIDGPVFAFPHKIARLWFPQYTEHTTPLHQDFVHFQSSREVYSCWHPVGDCPRELGGLAVLPGSHRVGRVVDHHFSLGAGSLSIDPSEHEDGWVSTDYEIGDVLFFHCLTIHGALPNVTPDRLRVSLDNRYQPLGAPATDHMLDPHLSGHRPLSWEQVYAGWSGSEDLRYYWQEHDFEVIAKDTSFQEKGFAEAVQRARNGDPLARLHLQRIADLNPDTEQAQNAARILAEASPVA